ncbi:MAG TPA: hypothetical protein VF268_07285 [Gammaproteobacteria bacterium]
MKNNYGKIISVLSVLLAVSAMQHVYAASVSGSFSGQGSAAATVGADSAESGNADAGAQGNASTSGNAHAGVNDGAVRDSAKKNGSAMINAGYSAAKSTGANARQTGRTVVRQGNQAADSVTVKGDAGALAGGGAVVETGDGIAIDLNSVSNGNAGVAVRPGSFEGSAAVIAGEVSRTSADVKGNATALIETGVSGTSDLLASTRGSLSANTDLSAEAGAVADLRQDVTSGVQAAVEEAVNETQATAEAAVETAVDTAAEVTAELAAEAESETGTVIEEAQNAGESVDAEVMGDFDLAGTGSGDVGL